MDMVDQNKVRKAKLLIYSLSIAIPVVVAVLFKVRINGVDLRFLPPIYAGINGITAILLMAALVAIKRKRVNLHQSLIKISLGLSVLFLGCYVAYHMTSDPTPYGGGQAWMYYSLLISHIVLSVVVIPLVLLTYLFAWQKDFVKHKRWARFAWPIWFYVAVTGVVVYLMIAPYYS